MSFATHPQPTPDPTQPFAVRRPSVGQFGSLAPLDGDSRRFKSCHSDQKDTAEGNAKRNASAAVVTGTEAIIDREAGTT